MRCHYEVLGVARDATIDTIKQAYKKAAIEWHPDRNPGRVEEATAKFQEIQGAFSVLTDPHERQWYDDHRESILRGGDGSDGKGENEINIWPYFSTSAYKGFDGEGGFYAVYSKLFRELDSAEKRELPPTEKHVPPPEFGDAQSPWATVSGFYQFWTNFASRRLCAWADKWNPAQGASRMERRLMEKDNKRLRDIARKEYSVGIRRLAEHLRKRDPRVAKHRAAQARAAAEAAARQQAEARAREEKKKAEQEAYRRAHAHEFENVSFEYDEFYDELHGKAEKQASDQDETLTEFYCAACNKSFKSAGQLQSHERSKKHRTLVAALRQQLLAEDAALFNDGATSRDTVEMSDRKQESTEIDQDPQQQQQDTNTTEQPLQTEAETPAEEAPAEDEDDLLLDSTFAASIATKQQDIHVDVMDHSSADATTVTAAAAAADRAPEGAEHTTGTEEQSGEKKPRGKQGSERKQRRKMEKSIRAALLNKPGATAELLNGTGDRDTCCSVCRESFSTRNKLFKHIKLTGHAALLPQPRARNK